MLRVLKATLLTGYTAEQIRLSSTSCDCGKNPAFNGTILCGWPNQKLYYQLISWECSSEDSGLVIWRKSMTSLFSKSCVCLTEDWGKMALSSPDRNHRRNYLPKATKQEELWAWDPHQCSCSAEPGCRSPRIMKNSQAVREICQLLYFSLEKSSFPLITYPVPYRHNSSWWSWYMCYLCFHIPFKETTRAWTLYERSPVWKKKKRKKSFRKAVVSSISSWLHSTLISLIPWRVTRTELFQQAEEQHVQAISHYVPSWWLQSLSLLGLLLIHMELLVWCIASSTELLSKGDFLWKKDYIFRS